MFLLLQVQPVVWLSVLSGTSIREFLFFGGGKVPRVGGSWAQPSVVLTTATHSSKPYWWDSVQRCSEGAQECLCE